MTVVSAEKLIEQETRRRFRRLKAKWKRELV